MEQDFAFNILKQNKKELIYCEIDIFLNQLKIVKPHLNISQYICSQHKFSSTNSGQFNGATIIIRVIDTKIQVKKSLKVFFLDRFEDKTFVEDIFHLFENTKNLLRTDILLQIYDSYFISLKNEFQAFFVIEQEDIEAILSDFAERECSEIQYVMKTAINYCFGRSHIKYKTNVKDLKFPKGYYEHFYIVKGVNNEIKVKLNLLSTDLFMNPFKIFQVKQDQPIDQSMIQENEDNYELINQLNDLKINTKTCSQIKKENLIQMIQQYGQILLLYHDIQIFEIISKHPKYDDFELIEVDDNFFILGSKIKDQKIYLKVEKFSTLRELEDITKRYDQYSNVENNMFIPFENYEKLILEDHFYLLIQEKALPNIFIEQIGVESNIYFYESLELILNKENYSKKEQLRNIQIIIQLIRYATVLQNHQINHGLQKLQNVIVKFPYQFTSKSPQIFTYNPLFMKNKEEEKAQQFNFEKDIIEIEKIIFQFLNTIQINLIDSRVIRILSREISKYLQSLTKQFSISKIELQNEPLSEYIGKLEDLLKVFEDIYKYYKTKHSDKYVKLNKNWLISVINYSEEDSDFDDNSDFEDQERNERDQCTQCKLFQMGVQKVNYYNPKQDILESIAKNTNIKSLNIKDFNYDKKYLESIFKNCKKLQKFKLEIRNYCERVDFSFLKDQSELKQIKIMYRPTFDYQYVNCKNMINQFNYLVTLFESNRNFICIDIYLSQELKDRYNIYEQTLQQFNHQYRFNYDPIFNNLYKQSSNLFQSSNPQLSSCQVYRFQERHGVEKYKKDYTKPFQKSKTIYEESLQDLQSYKQESQQSLEQILQRNIQNQQKDEQYIEIKQRINQSILYSQQQILIQQKNIEQPIFNSYNQNINECQQQLNKLQEIIQTANDNQILENILNKDMMISQLKQTINTYFKLFYTEQLNINLLNEEQWFLKQINELMNKYKYIYCSPNQIFEANRWLLLLKFKNIFNENIGELTIKLQINNQKELEIISHCCKSYERYICLLQNKKVSYNLINLVERWMMCEYISELKQYLFEQNEKQSCSHYDYVLMQRKLYQNQLCLKKFTFYLEFCDIIKQQMLNTINYFQFSQHNSQTLIELNLYINDLNKISNNFLNSLRSNLECAKSLVQLNVGYSDFIYFKRSFMKMKRIVVIKKIDISYGFKKYLFKNK